VVFRDTETGKPAASLTLFFAGFRYIGAFNAVEFQGSVTWRYREAP